MDDPFEPFGLFPSIACLELDALDTEGGGLLKWESSPLGVAVGGADRW